MRSGSEGFLLKGYRRPLRRITAEFSFAAIPFTNDLTRGDKGVGLIGIPPA
jgi:hypothetical protein